MNIYAYVGMTVFNIISLFVCIMIDDPVVFLKTITVIIANFLLDLFTIGVNLYLNMKATSQHKLHKRLKEEHRRAKQGYH